MPCAVPDAVWTTLSHRATRSSAVRETRIRRIQKGEGRFLAQEAVAADKQGLKRLQPIPQLPATSVRYRKGREALASVEGGRRDDRVFVLGPYIGQATTPGGICLLKLVRATSPLS
eukprot:768556-Hanusia_phi.AAC.7